MTFGHAAPGTLCVVDAHAGGEEGEPGAAASPRLKGGQAGRLRGPVRVLLLLDRPVLARVIALAFAHGPYATQTVPTATEALRALTGWQPHLAVIDMDADGAAFLAAAGPAGAAGAALAGRLPVIALTRRGDLATTLDAFERGVDDLLTVPLAPEELLARTLAVLRRTYREAAPFAPVIRRGELELDLLNRSVRAGGHELRLTPLEQHLLYLLAANDDRVLTREEILDHLWGVDFVAESNVVDRHVRSLRAKLQNDWREPRYIATVPGRGYRFLPSTADARGDSTGYSRGAGGAAGGAGSAPGRSAPG
jgi:DNA-binding response OmpR family regulator